MQLEHHMNNDTLVVHIGDEDGSLIPGDIEQLIDEILNYKEATVKKVAFDMSLKNYLNSWGLGQLIKAKDILSDKNFDLHLINLTKRVATLLNMVGIEDFFKIVSSEQEIR